MKYSILIPRGESAMIKNITLLDSILDVANCVDINDNNTYIARKVIENCVWLKDMSLEDFLETTNINGSQFKRFYKLYDCNNFSILKERIGLLCDIRKEQVVKQCQWQKQEPLARVIFNLTNYNDFNDFFNVELIDRICKQIYQSKRIIMYGAMGLLNLTHDFQIDMKLFGKDFIRSSMYEDKALVPQKDDFVWLFSMMGRTMNMVGTTMRLKIFNGPCKKLLITQHGALLESDFLISLNTDNDYYEGQYVFMFYLDMIKTRYYELYIKEN